MSIVQDKTPMGSLASEDLERKGNLLVETAKANSRHVRNTVRTEGSRHKASHFLTVLLGTCHWHEPWLVGRELTRT